MNTLKNIIMIFLGLVALILLVGLIGFSIRVEMKTVIDEKAAMLDLLDHIEYDVPIPNASKVRLIDMGIGIDDIHGLAITYRSWKLAATTSVLSTGPLPDDFFKNYENKCKRVVNALKEYDIGKVKEEIKKIHEGS